MAPVRSRTRPAESRSQFGSIACIAPVSRSARALAWGIPFAFGCSDPREHVGVPSPAVRFDDFDVVSFEVFSSVSGAVPLEIPVRALNSFGVSVPTDSEAVVSVDGVLVDVGFDGYGYGMVTVDDPGWVRVDDGIVYAFAAPFGEFSLDPIWQTGMTAPERGVAVSAGALGAEGNVVWWAGRGAESHVVLAGDGPILGLERTEVDVDGVSDAIAWTETIVFVLRGRGDGGMSWGGAFRADGYTVVAASSGDLSGDNLTDVAIVWMDAAGRGVLDVWEGDARFSFAAAEPATLTGRPISFAVGDNLDTGADQATVLYDDGTWGRFGWAAEGRYIPFGPDAPSGDWSPPVDGVLLSTGDVDADQGAELVVATRRAEGSPRDLWVADLLTDSTGCRNGREGAQCEVEVEPFLAEDAAWYATGDGNDDLLSDIFLLDGSRQVVSLTYNIDFGLANGVWERRTLFSSPDYGPLDTFDLDSDGWLDIVVVDSLVRSWSGRGWGDERFWSVLDPEVQFVREASTGPFLAVDLDGDRDNLEVVLFEEIEGVTYLSVVQYQINQGRALRIGTVPLDDAGAPVDDIAWCDDTLFVAVGGKVDRIDLVPSAPSVEASTDLGARKLACGPTPGNGDVAVLEDGRVRYLDGGSLSTIGQPVLAKGAENLALGDFGDGPILTTCDSLGCDIAFVSLGADSVFAVSDDGLTTFVNAAGEASETLGGGALTLADIDGDQFEDVVAMDAVRGMLTVWRSAGDRLAPPILLRINPGGEGPPVIVDGDGDQVPDLWLREPDGDLVYVRSGPLPPTTTPTN